MASTRCLWTNLCQLQSLTRGETLVNLNPPRGYQDLDNGFSASLQGFDPDSAIDAIFQWGDQNLASVGITDMPTQPPTGDNLLIRRGLTGNDVANVAVTQLGSNLPAGIESELSTDRNSDFLRQDNIRLRQDKDQLQDEVGMLRRQQSELRDRVRLLERQLQELHYLPSLQHGDRAISNALFTILDGVTALRKTLSSEACTA